MPRRLREEMPGGVFHVYARGNRRQVIFGDDGDRRVYLDLLGAVVEKYEWRMLGFCLMDNHVHHLIETPKPNLALGMNRLHGLYAQFFNTRHRLDGHLFQGRYGASRAESAGTVMYFAGYVALNPVRAGLCSHPAGHEWSSHAAVVGAQEQPCWLDVPRLLRYFGRGEDGLRNYESIVAAMAMLGAAGFDLAAAALSGPDRTRTSRSCG
jgi:putative transposase